MADGADGCAPGGRPPSGPGEPDGPGGAVLRVVARPGRPTLLVIEGALPVPVNRTRILQDTVTEVYPRNEGAADDEPELEFVLRRMGNRERIKRQDLFAKLRYVQVDNEGLVTERELPMGQVALEDVVMGLVGWNIEDGGRKIPINKETIQDYLSPEEFDFVLEKIRDLNPLVFGDRERTNGSGSNGRAKDRTEGANGTGADDPPAAGA